MPATPPVNFEELVRGPTGTTGKDYPYAIKASDLMQNFVFATLDIAEGVYEETTGSGGHRQRRLKIGAGTAANQLYIWNGNKITAINATPTEGSVLAFTDGAFKYIPAPSSGTYVLGSTDGVLSWIETEACDE
jgi:hypothetical protein